MEIAIVNTAGKKTGKKVKLNDEIFGIEPNDHAIYLDVKHYRANQRQGTHKTKERNEVAGSTRKIKRQKGTGSARAGSIKNPIFVGGGRVFGPRPRDYDFKLNKKLKRLARLSALSYKAKEKSITIIDELNFEAPKTKQYTEMIKNLQLEGKKTLVVLPEANNNVYLSSRNLGATKVITASQINTYDILNAQNIVLVENTLPLIDNLLAK
jgi:large subunit ribosomal protein L4